MPVEPLGAGGIEDRQAIKNTGVAALRRFVVGAPPCIAMMEPSQPAPHFTHPDQDGHDVSIGGFVGKTVVLSFLHKGGQAGRLKQWRPC